MTLNEAIRRNPYNPMRGNKSAYCRYLRYNVDGWYRLDSKEILRRWQEFNGRWCNTCEFKHLESECLGCAEYDEYDNLINLRNYKKEEEK